MYRVDRSYLWNYSHVPALPRLRRLPSGPGAHVLGYYVNSPLGVAAGPLLNSRWIEGYARLGYDVLTYATVRSQPHEALTLPNIRHVEDREEAAVIARRPATNGSTTIAVSLGLPSMEPEVWRKDVRRAKDRLGRGQMLVVSVVGTPVPDPGDAGIDAFIADYSLCATWASEAGADAVEVHLAVPNPFGEPGQMVYEHVPLAAQILYRVRTCVSVPIIARLGMFRTPRALHETATKLAPWSHGFVLVHAIPRRVVDEEGQAAFEGREWAEVVGAATFPVASRQVEELLAWRKAGAWPHAIFAVGGISTVERARLLLREGADATLVATAALFDPLFAARWRQALAAVA